MVRRLLSFWGPFLLPVSNPTPMNPPTSNAANGGNVLRGPHAANDGEPCWWTVSINAQEVARQIAVGQTPVDPLPYDTVQQGLPCSKLWAEVGWFREGIGRRAVFDIGPGMRISVNACNVQVNIIHPPEAVTVRGSPGYKAHAGQSAAQFPSLDAGPGLYLDTVLRASIVCSCAPASFESALLTQTLRVGPGELWQVPCPPGAVGLTVYVPNGTGEGLTEVGFWAEFIDPTGTIPAGGNLGPLPFNALTTDKTPFLTRPGNSAGAAGLNSTGTTLAYTFVWRLEF